MKSVFPEIRSFVSMQTLETPQITISVYDNKAAYRAIVQRDMDLEHRQLVDIFAHEESINCFYVDEEQLAKLLNGRSLFPTTGPQSKRSALRNILH